MTDVLKIYIDRLNDGHTEKITTEVSADFVDVDETNLRFDDPVHISGEVYLSEDHLIIHLQAKTIVKIPCSICNNFIPIELEVKDFYHAQPIKEITGAIYDTREPLREALLLELPSYVECNNGNCCERQSIEKYLKKENEQKKDETYYPFADL